MVVWCAATRLKTMLQAALGLVVAQAGVVHVSDVRTGQMRYSTAMPPLPMRWFLANCCWILGGLLTGLESGACALAQRIELRLQFYRCGWRPRFGTTPSR